MTKTNILVQYSDKFMLGFVKFLIASFFIVMLLYSKFVKPIQCNAMHIPTNSHALGVSLTPAG